MPHIRGGELKAVELANNLRSALEQARSQGSETVAIDQLLTYLAQVEDDVEISSPDLERYKTQLAQAIETNRQIHQSNIESFKAAVTSGQSAIRSLFLLNGGAAIAILAFLGHLTQHHPDRLPTFAWTLLPFTVGVFATATVSGLTYLSQVFFARNETEKYGFAFQFACVGVGVSSLVCFAIGMRRAYDAFVAF